jgi:acyl carrier protein
MTKPEITEILKKIMINELGFFENEFKETNNLEDMGMDSLDVLSFIGIAEEKFHIELEGEILSTSTISDVIDTIYRIKN